MANVYIYVIPAASDTGEARLLGPFSSADAAVTWAAGRFERGTWHDVQAETPYFGEVQ